MAKSRKIEPVHIFIEIVVITIGILIAYQLNNIKESRKIAESEHKILQEIKSNLELDKLDLLGNKRAHEQALKLVDSLRNWDGPYSDEIASMIFIVFRDYLYIPQTSAFETLKSKGVDLITNDSIRINIQRLHDFHYQAIIDYESAYEANQFYDDFLFVVENYFDRFPLNDPNERPKPKSTSTSWLKDSEVAIRLDLCRFEHQFSLSYYVMVEEEINQLIATIDKELNN